MTSTLQLKQPSVLAEVLRLNPYRLERLADLRNASSIEGSLAALRAANIFSWGPAHHYSIPIAELKTGQPGPLAYVSSALGKPYGSKEEGKVTPPASQTRYAIGFNDGTSFPSDQYTQNGIFLTVEHVYPDGVRSEFYSATDAQIALIAKMANPRFDPAMFFERVAGLPFHTGF